MVSLGTTVEYAAEKWGGAPHYRGSMYVLGDDRHGTWLWGPAGRTISRGTEPLFVADQDVITLVPADGWWAAAWWLAHPDIELYVNINTPAVRSSAAFRYVDLDLDVVRRNDGTCEIVDQDEFEIHQVELGYPRDVVDGAARTAEEVLRAVTAGAPPFDGTAAERWVARARQADLPTL